MIVRVGCSSRCFTVVTERRSQKSVIISIALAGSEGTSIERRRVRVGQGSKGAVILMSCSCRCSPIGRVKCSWILDAININCAGRESNSIGQLNRVWYPETV